MAFAKTYESWEVRQIMKSSEGAPSPATSVGAHAQALHGASTSTGKLSEFADKMLDRTHKRTGESNRQWKARGGNARTSAFNNLIEQAAAVTQAFNSTTGQAALGAMDNSAHAGKRLRMVMNFAGIEESDFLGTGTAPAMRSSTKNQASVAKIAGAAGVRIIVDKGPSTTAPFIQTCFPLDVCASSSWELCEMPSRTVLASG